MSQIKYLKIGDIKKEAIFDNVTTSINNLRRNAMQVTFAGTIDEAKELFEDSPAWGMSIEAEGTEIRYEDYSDFSIPVYYADTCDGNISVAMTCLSEVESIIETIYGGVNE